MLAVLCFAGPVAGFLDSLSWPTAPLGAKETAARRILYGENARHLEPVDLPAFRPDDVPTGCELPVGSRTVQPGPDQKAITDLWLAIRSYRRSLHDDAIERLRVNALAALPAPWLGTLEGCLGRSLLSPFCSSYVGRRIAWADSDSATETLRHFARIDREIEGVWCVAAHGVPPEPKPPTFSSPKAAQ